MFETGGDFANNFGQARGLAEAEFGKTGTPVAFQARTQSHTCRRLAEGFLLVIFPGEILGNALIGCACAIDKHLYMTDAENTVNPFRRSTQLLVM